MIIPVKFSESGYDIVIEKGAISRLKDYISPAGRAIIVSDDKVPESYYKTVAGQFENSLVHILPSGEASKSMEQFSRLLSKMLTENFTRKDCVIAVGGGVVGDLSGFAASCYMRGIDFYNIPTTLLSQLDSSIGGKTAINFDGIKNIVGAFHQPKQVIIDPEVLSTLDKRQFTAGLAEAIKIAATCDKELFDFICKSDDLYADITQIIARAVTLKKEIVEKDPQESHLRKVLNFGHTVGHGVESYCKGEMLHGECVALGMLPMCSDEVREQLKAVLNKYNLPVSFKADTKLLLAPILHDKKCEGGAVQAVLVNKISTFEFVKMSFDEISERTEKYLCSTD